MVVLWNEREMIRTTDFSWKKAFTFSANECKFVVRRPNNKSLLQCVLELRIFEKLGREEMDAFDKLSYKDIHRLNLK